MTIQVHDDADALCAAAADLLLAAMRSGRGHLVLGGGATPRPVYKRVGEQMGSGYEGVQIFFSDERMVPPGHVDSNFGMVRDVWLDAANFPAGHVHRIPGELVADDAAHLAEEQLRRVTGEPVRLDVAFLGLGTDGHTASLFPGSPALHETERLFVPVRGGTRVTATLPLLGLCDAVVFLVSGDHKAEAVRSALRDLPGSIPASLVRPSVGEPLWLLDRAAAAALG